MRLILDGSLSIEQVAMVAEHDQPVEVARATIDRMQRSRAVVERLA
jgi:histidine ammonia-lyase